MSARLIRERRIFEVMLIVVVLGLSCLFIRMGGYKMVILNLFYLPIALSGFYLGRSSAGVLAVFCVIAVAVASTLDTTGFAAFSTPTMVYLVLTVWGATLGLTAILVGTLCDERAAKVHELQEAYVGVIEVVSKYLQTGDPKVTTRFTRTAELSRTIGEQMNLTPKDIDDIRVGALLHDLENVEITARLITKAVNTLEANARASSKHTFLGMDLAESLGSVLHGVVPLLIDQDRTVHAALKMEDDSEPAGVPLGAQIIRVACAFDALTEGDSQEMRLPPDKALHELRNDTEQNYNPDVLNALEQVVRRSTSVTQRQPAMV